MGTEFSFETEDRPTQNKLSRYLPGVVESKDVDEWTKEGQLPVVVFNPQNKNWKLKRESAATRIYAQNVAQNVNEKDSQWNIVAEVYTAQKEELVFPKNQSHNVMSIFAPFSDDCDHFYRIAYSAYMMVIFHNVAITATVDAPHQRLFEHSKHVNKYDFSHPDVFQYYEDKRPTKSEEPAAEKDQIQLNNEVGVPSSIRSAEHNKKSIEQARAAIVKHVEEFRFLIQDTKRIEGKEIASEETDGKYDNMIFNKETKKYEPFDLENYKHFELVADKRLAKDDKAAQYALEKIRMNFDILYSKLAKPKEATMEISDEEKGSKEDVLLLDESLNKEGWTRIAAAGKSLLFSMRDGQKLIFPTWFYKNLYTMSREVVPKKGEEWSVFEERINIDIKKEDQFVCPEFEYVNALDSYIITDMVVPYPGGKMHSESLKSLCLGLFDAFEHAHDTFEPKGRNRGIGRKELGDFYLLADMEPEKKNDKYEDRWVKSYKGAMRDFPIEHFSKEHLVTDIKFPTRSKQVKANLKTVDVILKEFVDAKTETFETKEELVIEAEVAYKPVRQHNSRLSAKAAF